MRTIITVVALIVFSVMKTIANEHHCIIERVGKGIFLYNYETQKEIKLLDIKINDFFYLRDFKIKEGHLLLEIVDRKYKPYSRCLYYEVDTLGVSQSLFKIEEIEKDGYTIKETLIQKDGAEKSEEYPNARFSRGRKRGQRPEELNGIRVSVDQLKDGSLLVFKDGNLYHKFKNRAILYNSKFGPGYYAPVLSYDGKKLGYGYSKQIVPLFYSKHYIGIMDIETKKIDLLHEESLSGPLFSFDNTLILCHSAMARDCYSVIINLKTKEVRRIEASYMMWLE